MSEAPSRPGELQATSRDDPLDTYQLLGPIGEGSYGSVFKALHKADGRIVAVKVVPIDHGDTIDLHKEISILKECQSPFIVDYYGTYQRPKAFWIVMEYCDAGSLLDLMGICERTLSEAQIACVMKQALRGLVYLHSRKKIHRDVKAGNILLTTNGTCKLADFGVSAELESTLSKRQSRIGTPFWMGPEVLREAEYDGRADIWSLGITAIELAVGEPPHSGVHPMRAIFLIPRADPPTLLDTEAWSDNFHDFLAKCLIKDPEKRPTASELTKHVFITSAGPKDLIAALVEESMDQIDEYRLQEMEELVAAEQEAKNAEVTVPTGKPGLARWRSRVQVPMEGSDANFDDGFSTMVDGQYGTMIASDLDALTLAGEGPTPDFMVAVNSTNPTTG